MNYHTYTEIKTQTEAWKEAVAVTVEQAEEIRKLTDRYEQVIFTGCGSTYYLSLAGSALFQTLTNKSARAVPASELLFNTSGVINKGSRNLLVAVSRSGTTTETLRAVEMFKREQLGEVIVISNYDTSMSQLADLKIIIPSGQEQSVAQTRSFASMYVAATALCVIASGKVDLLDQLFSLPEVGNRLMDQYEPLAKETGENLAFDRFYFLGSGTNYGLACEVNLKMKEMTLTHSEPFYFMEFRHGPMSMVNENTVIVGLLSDKNLKHEKAVLDEMAAKGACVLALSEKQGQVTFESGIAEEIRSVLYLPVLQLMACYRSVAKGMNPDSPKNLTAVVKLDL